MHKLIRTFIALLVIAAGHAAADAQAPAPAHDDLHLSPEVRSLLQEEMREITVASQAILMSYVAGDWASIKKLSEQISASYVMARKLSASQRQELTEKLPAQFKHMDMEFHARAEKLAGAAEAGDPEIVAFHFNRLLESCASCHAAYARSRFPGFSPGATKAHGH